MIDDDINSKYKIIKLKLDKHSPSFCVAKWKQVTIHLDTGRTHSCHHPITHKIPLDEIVINPSALHNTNYKKDQRRMMLEGQRPQECDYCWKVEDSAKSSDIESYSDRVVKSADIWARDYIDNIPKLDWKQDTNPSNMEVNFGSTCNFKCSYCNPEVSSKWMEEIRSYGGYKLINSTYNGIEWFRDNDRIPIPTKEINPYIDAFWKWWPNVIKDLRVFRITGGEPLLNKNTFRVLDHLIDNPRPDLSFSINSNLCVPKNLFNEFIEKISIIQERRAVKDFKLYTSCEAHGNRAEYIRFGLNYDQWLKNCETVLRQVPDSRLTIMSTFNILSVTSFKFMLEDLLALKNKYTIQPTRPHTVSIDVPYIRWPEFMVPWLIPVEWLSYIEDTVTWMYQNLQQTYWPPLCGKGFFDYEIKRLERLFLVTKQSINTIEKSKLNDLRQDFVAFVAEHDKRRGTDFLKTFPEFQPYLENWRI